MQLEATAEAGHERGRGDRCGMWGSKIPIRHRNQSFRALQGPFGPVPGLSKAVSVHVSYVRVRGEAVVVQLRWSASGPTELFPVMEADLEIAPMGARQSQLGFSGSYDPPLGSFGRQLDRLLLHQLAEATVRAMLRQLVEALLVEPAPELASAPVTSPRCGIKLSLRRVDVTGAVQFGG
jgi:hypothetical protein